MSMKRIPDGKGGLKIDWSVPANEWERKYLVIARPALANWRKLTGLEQATCYTMFQHLAQSSHVPDKDEAARLNQDKSRMIAKEQECEYFYNPEHGLLFVVRRKNSLEVPEIVNGQPDRRRAVVFGVLPAFKLDEANIAKYRKQHPCAVVRRLEYA